MELKELREKKKKIEQEISKKISQFHKETGVRVDGVNVYLFSPTSSPDESFRYSTDLKVTI